MNERIKAAMRFAEAKHAGQYRIGGQPYITHPVAVFEMLREKGADGETLIAALFHDLLEDTDATEAEIRALGGENVLEAVRRLTKPENYRMADYIAGIRENPIAFAVKAADRLHNLRCAVEADEAFRRKYIAESREWYMDFDPEIPAAVRALENTLKP